MSFMPTEQRLKLCLKDPLSEYKQSCVQINMIIYTTIFGMIFYKFPFEKLLDSLLEMLHAYL